MLQGAKSAMPGTAAETELFGSASNTQLLDCARLLARSVALHRARFGVVPLEWAASGVVRRGTADNESAVRAEARRILTEAMHLVSLREPSEATPADSVDEVAREERKQPRVLLSVPIQVSNASGSVTTTGTLTNISWGGAAFHVREPVGAVDETLKLALKVHDGEAITLVGQVLRLWQTPLGQGVVMRFTSLSTEDDERFERLLLGLLREGVGGGQRREPRLAQRLEIQYGDDDELQAVLHDISQGGMRVTMPEPLSLNQSVQVVISDATDERPIKLRARVVHQDATQVSGVDLYQVGLEFEHPDAALKRRVNHMMERLIQRGKP